jgi:branched-chain amino acid transport system substrate-binding protein
MPRSIRIVFATMTILLLVSCQSKAVEESKVIPQTATQDKAERATLTVSATATPEPCTRNIDQVNEIRIGATVPLSPPGAVEPGEAMQYAIEIAAEQLNTQGGVLGKPVEVIFYDTAGSPDRGTEAIEYLVNQACVVGVVGEYHSSAAVTMVDAAHKYHIPVIFAETWNETITATQYPEVFRIAPTSSMVEQAKANYLEALGAQYVAIVTENTDYGILSDQGMEDYTPVIAAIQANGNPDALIVMVPEDLSFNFEKQATQVELMPDKDTVCIANQAASQPQFWLSVPNGTYCVFQKIGLIPALSNEVTQAFAEAYRQRFPIFPESYALEAYDSLRLIAEAIERAGSLDADAIIKALEMIDITLTQGRYYFPYGTQNPVPEDQPEWWWHQWPDPAVLFLQYYEQGQNPNQAAVVYPEVYQTHGTFLIPYGEKP